MAFYKHKAARGARAAALLTLVGAFLGYSRILLQLPSVFAQPAQPEYAKRPKNAYMMFAQERRPSFGGSGKTIGEIAKAIGAEWKEMGVSERKPFEEAAAEDRTRYEREIADGLLPKPKKSPKRAGVPKKKKDGPKRSLSAYLFFTMDKRAEFSEGRSVTEVAKILGAEWKKVDASGRKKYEKLAAEDKERYQKELAEFEAVGAEA